jgi:UDP-2,3-diacylglucosamine hydrolase
MNAPHESAAAVPSQIEAPTHWRRIDFLSDLHLHDSDLATFLAWRQYMETTQADAVFILGDWFEVWLGDDALSNGDSLPNRHLGLGFVERVVRTAHFASSRAKLYFLHGNRDFLLGPDFERASGAQRISDPSFISAFGQRAVVAHGDALCLSDTAYLKFREQVRGPHWQTEFLVLPLSERHERARAMRTQSMQAQRDATFHDADATACRALLDQHQASTLIHGHTHRPGAHVLSEHQQRLVLSDWDAQARPARAQVLSWTASGFERQDLLA